MMDNLYRVPDSWRMALRIVHLGLEILIDVKTVKVIGCAEVSGGTVPDINLFDLIGHGFNVSERHVLIGMETSGIYLIDQGAATGTSLNGIPLSPLEAQVLTNGDRIKLGELEIQVAVVENPLR